MTTKDTLLAQGIAAAKAGDSGAARMLLAQAVHRHPDSEAAWLWLSSVLETPQGRIYCLRKVLSLNPENRLAQRGLAALEKAQPGPVVVALAKPAAVEQLLVPAQPRWRGEAAARPPRRLRPSRWVARPQFWKGVVVLLGTIALSLTGLLAYTTLGQAGHVDEGALVAAIAPMVTPSPAGTLRPTFTATAIDTPAPTDTPIPTDTPTPTPTLTPEPTETPVPTDTPVPTATATRRPRRQVPAATPTSAPTPVPKTELPARILDPRLPALGVRVEPAFAGTGQRYWRLVEARWTDGEQSGGKHSVFVEVQDLSGGRAVGQPVVFQWADGSVTLPIQDRPPPDWGVDFGMYNTLGSYAVYVDGAPSDRIVGLGLGTIEAPNFTIHTCFYLTFRLVQR